MLMVLSYDLAHFTALLSVICIALDIKTYSFFFQSKRVHIFSYFSHELCLLPVLEGTCIASLGAIALNVHNAFS